MIGMTAMSWNNKAENDALPPTVFCQPFSLSVDMMIAVDDRANVKPMAKPTCHVRSKPYMAANMISMAVKLTCNPPALSMVVFMRHR